MMKNNLPAKLTRPKAVGILLRKSLFRTIKQGLDGRVAWICGHPGSGKTTLVSSLMESSKGPCLWYHIDSGDRDPASFIHYLGLAAAGAGCKKKLPHLTQEHLSKSDIFTHNFFRDLFGNIPEHSVLVFDNFQEASEYREFTDIVLAAIDELPDNCSIIIISREEPNQAFSRYCLNAIISIIGNDDLRLNKDEMRQLAKTKGFGVLTDDVLSRIHEKTLGWMAGVLLMYEGHRLGLDAAEWLKGSVGMLFKYFLDEVFKKIDEKTADFLLKTSLIPSCFTIEMATNVSGNGRSEKILSDLISRNFFTEKRIIGREIQYQYHPFFREFLLSKANEAFSVEKIADLRNMAAEASSKNGFIEDAAELVINAGNWNSLQSLIRQNAAILLAHGRFRLMDEWIQTVPGHLMKEFPWLFYYQGLCRLNTDPAEARALLESAYTLFENGDLEGRLSAWCGLVDTYLYEWKDFKPLDRLIAEFYALMKKGDDFPSEKIKEQVTICMFNALVFRQPQHKDIGVWEERVVRLFHSTKSSERRAYIGRHIILYFMWTGAMAKGKLIIDTMSGSLKQMREDPLAFLMWTWSKALFTHASGDFAGSLKDVREGLKIAETAGIRLLNMMLYGQGVYSSLALDNIKDAEAFLNRMSDEVHSGRCYTLIFYHHQAALVELHKGELARAIEFEKEALRLSESAGSPFSTAVRKYSLANILIEACRYDEAAPLVKELLKDGELLKSALFTYSALLLECVIELKKGTGPSAKKLEGALSVGRANGINIFPFLTKSTAARLALAALELGIESEFIKNIIRKAELTPCNLSESIEDWPWPIKIYTFGKLEIYTDGKRIEFSGKVQQKPLAMLRSLIAFGGKNVTQEAIVDALWPDSDGDAAYRAFATTLHRLRKLLGNDRAILFSEGIVSLDPSICWVDTWGFTGLIKKSEANVENRDSSRLIEKALKLYRGPFLMGENLHCIISMRERLRANFMKQIGLLASRCEHSGDLERAVELYNIGISEDELAEKFYRNLMLCHSRLGYRSEAIRIYKRCEKVLLNTLCVSPSPETEAIYKKLSKSIFK